MRIAMLRLFFRLPAGDNQKAWYLEMQRYNADMSVAGSPNGYVLHFEAVKPIPVSSGPDQTRLEN